MSTYVFDIETDGFLDVCTKIHSLVLKNVDTDEVFSCAAEGKHLAVSSGLEMLKEADRVIGHNIISFDLQVLKKLFGIEIPLEKVVDTMVLGRLVYPDTSDWDGVLMKTGALPKKLFKKHTLEAWGYRLGNYKGDFEGPWDNWSETMQEYCEQDVEVTHTLYKKLLSKGIDQRAFTLEHKVRALCTKMERNGWPFDEEKAVKLYAHLAQKRDELTRQLQEVFPPKTVTKQLKTKVKETIVPFNPGSRQQIAQRLTEMHGWKPIEFTDSGQAKVDETILSSLPYPEAKLLSEYMMVQKRIGQLAEGDNAWLKLVKEGRVHGGYNTNGAVTGRATHINPNIAQVPAGKSEYGHECRELFTVPPGWKQFGADTSGLELRCFAHYQAPYDGGYYVKVVTEGDVHTTNQQAAGLPTRDNAKTFIYALIYGAGDWKIGTIINKGKAAGAALKKRFISKVPGYGKLKRAVEGILKARKVNEKRQYLTGLDGRQLSIRSDHSALNTLLQSAGAIICKYWIVRIEERLIEKGYKHGWDGDFVFLGWIHDEVQIAIRDEALAPVLGEIVNASIKDAETFFRFLCPLATEWKLGNNWAETH